MDIAIVFVAGFGAGVFVISLLGLSMPRHRKPRGVKPEKPDSLPSVESTPTPPPIGDGTT